MPSLDFLNKIAFAGIVVGFLLLSSKLRIAITITIRPEIGRVVDVGQIRYWQHPQAKAA